MSKDTQPSKNARIDGPEKIKIERSWYEKACLSCFIPPAVDTIIRWLADAIELLSSLLVVD